MSRRALLAPMLAVIAVLHVTSSRGAEPPPKVVTLLAAGAEPRAPLRYTPTVGAVERGRIVLRMSSRMEIGGMPVPLELPPLALDVRVLPTAVGPAGDFRFAYEVTGIGTTPDGELDPAIAGELRGMVGTRADVHLSATGRRLGATYAVPDGAPPTLLDNLQRSLHDATAPLPEAPVGIGARWETRETVTENGIRVQRTTTMTLRALDDRKASLDVSVLPEAATQELDLPDLPAATTARLERLTGRTVGTLVLDLRGILPARAETNATLETTVSIAPANGPAAPMSMATTVSTTLERLDP